MIRSKLKTLEVLKFANLCKYPQIEHLISKRSGGFSLSPFDKLNIALHVDDDAGNVIKNRKVLADNLKISLKEFVLLKQIHSNKVVIIKLSDRGRGSREYREAIGGADAMITNQKDILLIVQVADCVPILLFDPKKKVTGVVHAGWRGTIKGIAGNTVKKMKKEFDCEASEIVVGIGPSIGPCCYEIIDKDLLKKWRTTYSQNSGVFKKKLNKLFLDLWRANEVQLMEQGVKKENIEIARICTACNTDKFYSYRKEGKTGRFGAGIILK